MSGSPLQRGLGLLGKLKAWHSKSNRPQEVDLNTEVHLQGQEVRVLNQGIPIEVTLGRDGFKLHIHPSPSLRKSSVSPGTNAALAEPNTCFIIIDPSRHFDRISGFLRLEAGATLLIGRADEQQNLLFQYPGSVERRHLTIANTGDSLIFKDLHTDAGTCIAALPQPGDVQRLAALRHDKLRRLRRIFGGPLHPLDGRAALALLQEVNAILDHESHRPVDARNHPGGLLVLPDKMTPIIIGDLHAQVDNLLKILSENAFLDALERQEACLVILGDAVHSEVDGEMDRFDTSLLVLDLIFKLKVAFPKQVFYLRGNHDGFSTDIRKAGIPQGLLWEHAVRKGRGEAYKEALETFYDRLPLVAMSRDFLACHAAPPKARTTRELLINTYQYPGLVKELIWNRLQRPNYPAGYSKGDVKRFRKALDISPEAHFIVAHNPLTQEESVWVNAGEIESHHIVFSGRTTCLALFTRINGAMIPMVFPTEPMLREINGLPEEG